MINKNLPIKNKFCNFTNQLTNVHCALSNIIYQL